jgi:hypothetical protein
MCKYERPTAGLDQDQAVPWSGRQQGPPSEVMMAQPTLLRVISLGSLLALPLASAHATGCTGVEPPAGGASGGALPGSGGSGLGGTAVGGAAGAGHTGGRNSGGGAAGSAGVGPTCGGMTAGSCVGAATCECCPAGGPTQHCLCTTPCTSSSDCLDAARPICDRPTTGGTGLCRDASFTCCWGCD